MANRDIWLVDLTTGAGTRFTSHPANDWFPAWSPDGCYLAFSSDRVAGLGIYRKAVTGTSDEEPLPAASEGVTGWVTDWSPDSKSVVYQSGKPSLARHLDRCCIRAEYSAARP